MSFFDSVSDWVANKSPASTLLKGAEGVWKTVSGQDAADAAERAAAMQAEATREAIAEQRRQFDIGQANIAPWMAASRRLMGIDGTPGASLRELQSTPGYQFRLGQGQRMLEGGLAARGGMGSGKAMTAATEYGQNYASNEYANRLNQLAQQAGVVSGQGQIGMQYGQRLGDLITGGANAQGAAGMAAANARQSGLMGLISGGAKIFGGM